MQEAKNKIHQWVESGKQLGKVFSSEKNGQICWTSIAIQKWKGEYVFYLDSILESKMASEEYLTEECVSLTSYEALVELFCQKSPIQLAELLPCKGQRIFNPDFAGI